METVRVLCHCHFTHANSGYIMPEKVY